MTHAQTITNHLLAGQSISTWEAYELYRITCLAQRISELRSDGMPILSRTVKTNKERGHYSVYWLEADYIATHKAILRDEQSTQAARHEAINGHGELSEV